MRADLLIRPAACAALSGMLALAGGRAGLVWGVESQARADTQTIASASGEGSPVDWVNMYVGTSGVGSDYGGTMPLVTTPFGMTNWTAQTRQNRISVSSYEYEDKTISGFIGTHQPAIWMGDYGYVTLIPEVDAIKTAQHDRGLPFARSDEVTTPYYYSVLLDAGGGRRIRAEITATDHCGLLRFTFPAKARPSVVLEATRFLTPGHV